MFLLAGDEGEWDESLSSRPILPLCAWLNWTGECNAKPLFAKAVDKRATPSPWLYTQTWPRQNVASYERKLVKNLVTAIILAQILVISPLGQKQQKDWVCPPKTVSEGSAPSIFYNLSLTTFQTLLFARCRISHPKKNAIKKLHFQDHITVCTQ